MQYFKNVTPLLVFGPPAAKSWRRACDWSVGGDLAPLLLNPGDGPATGVWEVTDDAVFARVEDAHFSILIRKAFYQKAFCVTKKVHVVYSEKMKRSHC